MNGGAREADVIKRRGLAQLVVMIGLIATLSGLVLRWGPVPWSQQPGRTLYVNRTDPTCGGQAPCYATIQAAITAAQAGDTIQIQAGTYPEQLSISGKNNVPSATEASRIIIEADPSALPGSVVLDPLTTQCTNGHGVRLQQSKFITLRGLSITGAGGQAISLLGGNNQNEAIHIERNRIFGNGSSECNGGITVARGNPGTLIVNNLVYSNGRNAVTFIDADGGPHYLVSNTIHGNAWSGVNVARNHQVLLVNNIVTANGTASGSTGGRFGVSREGSTSPNPAGIQLLSNLLCGNRLDELDGPILDATDAGNLTPTGSEGPGVSASPGCQTPATVYANLPGLDGELNTADDDFTLAAGSPAIDAGPDPRTLGLDPTFNALFEADYAATGARPRVGTPGGTAKFDMGALEARLADTQAPAVTFLNPPASAVVRGTVTVQAQATDAGSGVASLSLSADSQPLTATLSPTPPAPSVTATASWNTLTVADGAHTLAAAATDQAGNSGSATRVVTVDNTAPDTQITDGPSGTISETNATFTFTGTDNLTPTASLQFAWRLDGGAFTAFSSATSATFTNLAPAAHTFEVKARDLAGNEDPTPASRSFAVVFPGDFILVAAPAVGTVLQGASTAFTVQLLSGGPFTNLASLGVSGLPAGVTAAFSSPALTGGQRETLTVTVASNASVGSFPLTLSATTGASTRTAGVTLTVLQGGRTALTGRLLVLDGTPVVGARLILAGKAATTDAAGNFLLVDLPEGVQTLSVDTNAAQVGFPIYGVDVTLTAGQVTELPPFWITPPPPPERFTPINNATQDQTFTDPRFPGASITLPAGVTITGWDGQPKTKIAIERLSPDRLPMPPPPFTTRSLYQFFFGTPMGGLPSAPLPVTLPNDAGLAPGEKTEIWYYDAAPFAGVPAGWRRAGPATVSDDGTMIVSDPGVGIERFCGVCGAACFPNPEGPGPGPGPEKGDPVDLSLGQMIAKKTDLVIPGRLPLVVHRTYTPFDPFGGVAGFSYGLGPGWGLSFEITLLEMSPSLRRVILPGNYRFDFVRQPDGRFVNTTDPRWTGAALTQFGTTHTLRLKDGTVWSFASGWLNRASGRPITGLDLLIEQSDRNGNRLTITRDQFGQITQVTEPGGRSLLFTLDATGTRITAITDPIGRSVRYGYDGAGRLATVTDPTGGVTGYTYDSTGRILTITDPRGITYLVNEYDATGRVSRQTLADGGVYQFQYGGATTSTVINPRGNPSTYRLTPGRLASEVTNALGQTTRFERDARGQVLSTTDPLGRVTRLERDAAGNVTRVTDPAGRVRTFTYEATFNKVISITDPVGNITRFEYDTSGNLVATVDSLGHRTTIAVNAFGQRTSVTDAFGDTIRFEYDPVGNRIGTIDPLGNRTSQEYDAGGRLIARTDARGATTRFAYDALGRLTQTVDPLGGVTQLTYDGNGNLLSAIDPRGTPVSQTYDAMDRVATRTDALGATEVFEYDATGNVIRYTDRKGQATTFDYDTLGRRVGSTDAAGTTTSVVYDALGRLVQVSDSAGEIILREYDPLDQLVAETSALGTVSYQYDALGRRTSMSAPGQAPVSYAYDAASHLTQVVQGSHVVDLQYDALGRRSRLTLPNGVSTETQYDAASRVTAFIYQNATGVLGNLTYQYDTAGNRIGIGGSFARTLLPSPILSATYDAAGRQLTFGDKSLTYDANGNLTSITDPSGVTTFTWDARNRLVSLTGPGLTGAFAYDAFGRRVAKEVNGQLIEYLYDGDDSIEELTEETSVFYLRSLNIDEPWGRTTGSLQEFYLADALGSIVGLTDPAGTLTTGYSYEPFGGTATFGTPSAQALGFTGRENDGTGLYYYRARYYHPGLHRFISEDPAEGAASAYVYAGNRPAIATDPFGLFTLVVRGGFGTGPTGLSGSGQGGMQQITTRLRRIEETVSVRGPDETAAILADLRANQGDRTGVHVVCHSRGCDQILSQLTQNAAVHVDRLVTMDCYGFSGSCGVIPDNVDTNLNYWQNQDWPAGGPNRRPDGSEGGITNMQRPQGHSQIPGNDEVQRGIVNCIGQGQCGGGGRKE